MQFPLEAPRSPALARPRNSARLQLSFALLLIFIPLVQIPAQQPATPTPAATTPDLPSAPTPTNAEPPPQTTATLSGTIVDTDAATIPGALITLQSSTSSTKRTTVSDPQGAFLFTEVPPGPALLSVSAIGFASAETTIQAKSGEHLELPPVILPLAAVDTTVQAISQHEMAEQQLKVEEQQRLFGVVPTFYISYTWNAVPLATGQKFQLAWRSMIDPFTLLGAGISASIEQGQNTYPGYGLGAAGFAKRFGAAYGDAFLGTMIGGAILPSVFHQDPRYFYKGTGTVPSRAAYAISTVFRVRGDNGRWQPNYSDILGDLAAGGLSNAYYPRGDRGAETTFNNFFIGIGSDAINALVEEFVLRKLTRHPPPAIPER